MARRSVRYDLYYDEILDIRGVSNLRFEPRHFARYISTKDGREIFNGTSLLSRRNIKAAPSLTPAVIFAQRSLYREILDISGGLEEMWSAAMYHDDGNERLSEILVPISYDKTLDAFSLLSLSDFSFSLHTLFV